MKKSLVFSFSLIGQIGFATALPLVVFGILGRYLDRIYQSGHLFFGIGLILATIMVFFYLKQIIKKANDNVKDL